MLIRRYARTDIDGHTSFLVTDGCVVVQYDTSIVDGEEIQNSDVPFDARYDIIQEMSIVSDSVSGYLVSDMPELMTAIPEWLREHCYYRRPSDVAPVIDLKAYNGEFGSVSGLFNVKLVKDAIEAVGKNARCWLVRSDEHPCKFPFLFVAPEKPCGRTAEFAQSCCRSRNKFGLVRIKDIHYYTIQMFK